MKNMDNKNKNEQKKISKKEKCLVISKKIILPIFFALLIILFAFYSNKPKFTIMDDLRPLNLTIDDKDKYLACSEFVMMFHKRDNERIYKILPQEGTLLTGIREKIDIDMLIKCVKNIPPNIVHLVYKNFTRVVNMEGIDDEELKFMMVNYHDYTKVRKMEITEEINYHVRAVKAVTDEYKDKRYPDRKQKLIEKRKQIYEQMLREEEMSNNNDSDNSIITNNSTVNNSNKISEKENETKLNKSNNNNNNDL